MKFLVNIVLFLFLSFLATPTVIGVIEEKIDTSMVYAFSEEEIHKEVKEIPMSIGDILQIPVVSSITKSTAINSENKLKHDSASEEIFSPPPEFV
ncbi:hypothetical protein [Flavobacterium sp.]|uniref:hypothetical protein n=1 Tax=Flavobacterium sp. TaxID=239 RepID=UPI0028BD35B3|nr:hypothetical protein [Flavobacterium sp.]